MMGRPFFILLVAMLLNCPGAKATVLTVYNLNNTAIADYANIYEAYNNAADGDTILLYPSDLNYEANLVVTKRLFLIGGGYASQTLLPATNLSGTITFQAGADGASVESFGGRFNIAINGANHILVSRNHINTIIIENSYNALLTGNLIDGNSGPDGWVLVLNGNCLVEGSNNLLRPQPYPCGYSSTCYYGAVHMRGSSVLHMDNSIFISEGQITIYAEGGSVSGKNNLMFGAFRGAVDFHHSIHTNPWDYDGKLDTTTISKNNQIIPDISVVYTDFAANIFTLKSGSPAFGNGEKSPKSLCRYPLHPDVLTPAKVREIVESGYRTIYGNNRDEESDARRFAATSYALLEEKAAILQGYLHGSFTDVVLADRLGNGLFINNAGPDTIFRLVLIEKDLLSHDDTIFIGSFSADSHDRFPTTTFLPDPAEFADTPTVDRQIALVVSSELEGVVYSDTLIQTIHLRKPVYTLFSTTPSLGSRNEVYTDTGTTEVGFVSPVVPAPDQGKATASTSPNPTPSPSFPPILLPLKYPGKA